MNISFGDLFGTQTAYLEKANELIKQGLVFDAIDILEKGLLIYPDSTRIHYNLGNLYDDIGNLDKAKEHLIEAIDYPYAKANLSLVLLKMGDFVNARKYALMALKEDKQDQVAIEVLSYLKEHNL